MKFQLSQTSVFVHFFGEILSFQLLSLLSCFLGNTWCNLAFVLSTKILNHEC